MGAGPITFKATTEHLSYNCVTRLGKDRARIMGSFHDITTDAATDQTQEDDFHVTIKARPGDLKVHIYVQGMGNGPMAFDDIKIKGESVVEMQLYPQSCSLRSNHRKMDLVLPILEDNLHEIEDRYIRYHSTEHIRNADLDGVAYWPRVDGAKRRKFLLILTTRVNKYIQENDDKNCHETISLLGEHMVLLEHCGVV